MYSLMGQEKASDGSCLFGVAGLLLLTLVSLLALLFPDISSTAWYGLVSATTDILLFLGFFLFFIVPFSDTRAKYLLSFIMISCILLQVSLYQAIFHWSDAAFLATPWSIRLREGYAVFLIGLFLFTVISHAQKEGKIKQNINEFSLEVSEKRVTIGNPFLIKYTFSPQKMTQIESLTITFYYQQFVDREHQPYEERSLPVYQKKDCIADASQPFTETFSWTIPDHLLPEDGTRKDWGLNVQVKLSKGITLHTSYPLKVIWVWPDTIPDND